MRDKGFAEKLGDLLDKMEVPPSRADRRQACINLFRVSPFIATNLLDGYVPRDMAIKERIASNLGVEYRALFRDKKNNVN